MADETTLELTMPARLLDDLTAAADSRGVAVADLAREWIQDRLVHEREKQEGVARKVKRS
ncbi:MAG TPA: hypothetical protein VGJ44_24640 [Kribbellaceae bacterium]|jgi:hypothetical protein